MRKLVTIFAGSAMWLLVLATAAGAGGIVNLGPMTVDPSSGPAGTTFTVSGDGCGWSENDLRSAVQKESEWARFSVELWFEAGSQTANVPAYDAAWSHDFTVPDGTPAGDYKITATCWMNLPTKQADTTAHQWGRYDDGTFTVTEPAPTTTEAPTTTTEAPVVVAETTTTTAPPVTQAAPAAAELPRTGAGLGLLSAGGGMLLAGGAAYLAGRRRTHR